MTKNLFKVVILFLFLIFSNCTESIENRNSVEIVDFETSVENLQNLNLSILSNDIQYIPLLQKGEQFLKGVQLIDQSDSMILVSDLTNCLLFNMKGSVITKIGKQGRGPDEYQYINNIKFVCNNKILIQSFRDLLEFDIGGSVINKVKQFSNQNSWTIQSWICLNDSLFFGQIPNFSGNEEFKAVVYNKNGVIKFGFKNYFKFKAQRTITNNFSNKASIYRFGNIVRFKERVNDTLFTLTDNFDLVPIYVFSLGKFTIPYTDFFQSKTITTQYAYINNIFETTEYLFIDFISNIPYLKRSEPVIEDGFEKLYYTNKLLGIYSKKEKELTIVAISKSEDKLLRTGLFNDVDGGPKFYPEFIFNESTLGMSIEAIKLKRYIESESFKNSIAKYPEKKKDLEILANRLGETDNPILMLVRLKK